jgi:hypothetical protein
MRRNASPAAFFSPSRHEEDAEEKQPHAAE